MRTSMWGRQVLREIKTVGVVENGEGINEDEDLMKMGRVCQRVTILSPRLHVAGSRRHVS